MKSMKEQIFSMGERVSEKILTEIGETSIKISDKARGKCFMLGLYEPNFSLEMLKENIEE